MGCFLIKTTFLHTQKFEVLRLKFLREDTLDYFIIIISKIIENKIILVIYNKS